MKKIVLGLTGGIATGKSLAANYLKNLGARIIDADEISRKIVEPESRLLSRITEIWGEEILNPEGSLNRKKLGQIIFSSDEDREKLNTLLHPEIGRRIKEEIDKTKEGVAVVVAPLLFEAGKSLPFVDEIWVVYSSSENQKKRLMTRDNITLEEAEGKIRTQMPLEEKCKKAHVVLYNDGKPEDLKKQVVEEFQKKSYLFSPPRQP